MAKLTIPKLKASTFKGWAFVLVTGVVLALLALIDSGRGIVPDNAAGAATGDVAPADGSTGCVVEVATEELNVRVGPSQDAELLGAMPQGTRVDATTVLASGFRQLEDGRWASDQYLTPLPGTNCN